MTPTLIGKKLKMTQIYDDAGQVVPVTIVLAGPCQVVQVKTVENDGYQAAQIGFDDAKVKRTTKPEQGHFKKWSCPTPKRVVREVALDEGETPEPGSQLDVSVFEEITYVDVIGTSKGRGFQGTIKRHNASTGPKSHGSKSYRLVGSIGMHTWPARVLKGRKLPGQMGNKRTTARNLKIVKIEKDHNLLYIKGAVPGPTNGYVVVRRAKTKS